MTRLEEIFAAYEQGFRLGSRLGVEQGRAELPRWTRPTPAQYRRYTVAFNQFVRRCLLPAGLSKGEANTLFLAYCYTLTGKSELKEIAEPQWDAIWITLHSIRQAGARCVLAMMRSVVEPHKADRRLHVIAAVATTRSRA